MAESWSDDTRELRKKAKIIHECAFLPEFFPEFPEKDNLSKKETDKYFKIFFKILKDKSITVFSTNKETNILLAFFTIKFKISLIILRKYIKPKMLKFLF